MFANTPPPKNSSPQFPVKTRNIIIYVGIGLFLLIISFQTFKIISPGERAIIFRKYTSGLDKETIFEPGMHIVAPFNDFITYIVREQTTEETMDVLDKNGLSINVHVSVRFNPIYDKIPALHEQFGVGYIETLVIPEMRSCARKVMGRFSAEEIYSTKRKEVEDAIAYETETVLVKNYVEMKALLIRSINLPEQIKNAIENKLKQEQEALAYQFKLDREKSEAERIGIQAEGEARANAIINASLTPNLLKMRGIEATSQLSNSPNAKIIVIGGKDGLPLILGNQ